MKELAVGDAPVGLATFVAAASSGSVRVRLSAGASRRIASARAVADRYAVGDAPIYGLNTGLGGNLGHRIGHEEMSAFQAQILAGRSVGTGPPLAPELCRAALLARVIGAARGASGVSPAIVDLMVAMLELGLAPALPSIGSIGAGDLVLCAAMGSALIGQGEIWSGDRIGPAEDVLRQSGLAPAELAPKDALALANHSSVTVALAAFASVRADWAMWTGRGAAVLAAEGYGINPAIFDARLHALRPAAGQEAEAAWFRSALAGSALTHPGAKVSIQDALSFRTLAPAFGVAATAQRRLAAEVKTELNAGADSPAVLGAGPEGVMLSSPNFHTSAIALALDTMAIAHVQLATGAAQRVVKLMAPELSGLPKYLSPVGGASAGYMPVQKTVAALLGRIRLAATPASLDAMVVSEMVEDVAPQSVLAAEKLLRQIEDCKRLIAIEALVASQAVDLRDRGPVGRGARVVYDAVRAQVPRLDADRPSTRDIEAVREALDAHALAQALSEL